MSIAALIRKMAEAGATPEVIAMAVEAIEERDAAISARRSKDAERKARQRARQSRDSHGTVTDVSQDPPHPPLTPPHPQTPPLYPPITTTSDAEAWARAIDPIIPACHPAKADPLDIAACVGWRKSGFDLHADVIPAIRAACASPKHQPRRWERFTGWIERYHADRLTAEQARPPPVIAAPSPSLISPRGSPHARQAPKSAAAVLADLRSGSGAGYRGIDPDPWAGPVLEHDGQPPEPSRVQ